MTGPMPAKQSATPGRAGVTEQRMLRVRSITARATDATAGPWGYLRAEGAIVAPDLSDVALCLYDPDASFIAHARSDVPWLLGQLAAEQTASAALHRRLAVLAVAIGRANQALDRLPWQGDGLRHLIAEGTTTAEVVAAIHAAARALDPETLGLKDSGS